MKYLAVCALLMPLVFGASVPRPPNVDIDLIPDISTAADAESVELHLRQLPKIADMLSHIHRIASGLPDMSVASDADDATADDMDLIPDISVAADGDVPDMSVAADAKDSDSADADLVPDISVASDADEVAADDADLIPDMSNAADALDSEQDDADLIPDNAEASYQE
ncbi:uncharacterized protein LOC115632885 [Scaptodrosophila lebanonensis]|uniref:Uncharacterized protein LOC115632885 n=1 Tax=Drosophila lebanonensis TaxID=7225 RepID=A0A6J2UCA1_DROLE|nr:uncharacterized protein LOC115632885 [Scaptodrosophila lebanonensis]